MGWLSLRWTGHYYRDKSFAMIRDHLIVTRYFTFIKIDPTDDDFSCLFTAADEIDAFMGYSLNSIGDTDKRSLVGFFILRQSPTNAGRLVSHLPGFILRSARDKDFSKCCKGYIVLRGTHPFDDLKQLLFEKPKHF